MKLTDYLFLAIFLIFCTAENIPFSDKKSSIPGKQNNCFDETDKSDSIEESLCYDLNFLQAEINKIETPRIETLLKNFSTSLKSYIDVTNFNSTAFAGAFQDLQDKRDEIATSVNMVSVIGKFSKQLLFTMLEFQTMLDSTEYLKCYNVSHLPGHDLIHEVIELNIKIFALQDSWGDIDPGLNKPEENIKTFHDRLIILVRKFVDLPDKPYFLQVFFQEQALRAEARLEALSSLLSNSLE